MLGLEFKKAPPTVHVMHFEKGQLKRSGRGLCFFYFSPFSTLVDIPLASIGVPFVFCEVSSDFQPVTFQGQLDYAIAEPEKIFQVIDFCTDKRGNYLADNEPLEVLEQSLVNCTQTITKGIVQKMTLANILNSSQDLCSSILSRLQEAEPIKLLGLRVMSLALMQVSPSAEMSRALEAHTREEVQRQADQAIYARRNAAVEEERTIKENELKTEIAVETKKREIAETRMAADIALEEQRSGLIDRKVENDKKEAESQAFALGAVLAPVEKVDWRTLLAIGASNGDPRLALSLAFQELAENAGKIGQLTLTPDLVQSLLGGGETHVRKDRTNNPKN